MEKWFRRSLMLMGLMFFLFIVILFSALILPSLALLESLGVALLCISPFVFLATAITGIGSLGTWLTRRNGEKAKRGYIPNLETEDAMMQKIMSRLSFEERAYLREQLAAREMGLGEDGELMTLEELMREKQKRG